MRWIEGLTAFRCAGANIDINVNININITDIKINFNTYDQQVHDALV